MGIVIAVSGSVGGIGTSTFAWALAQQAHVIASATSCLIDGQFDGAPLDVIAGCEGTPGIRWSQVRVRSTEIAASVVLEALPSHLGVAVLSADGKASMDPVALVHLVEVLRQDDRIVVLDLAARDGLRESLRPDIDLLLLPPTMPGIIAAHASMRASSKLILVNTGLADVTAQMVEAHLGGSLAGIVRWQRSIRAAAAAATGLPPSSDVMRLAGSVLATVHAA